ncbi:hypothetical protein TREMEDRAFT_59006 [Tremella mesenterica DSM 1558]|uniref:uncharacterized protein n=1 Tax=Tremella mesenterica (strain ATCC 24925 / CBS 8224 / DSM 1558 / NBRC 9311 / NRRL Y-6157 / RJB 2259-6 / UBC 559-6) TaxID=578456 RepID=UPI0003F492A3|nr:uncharacterized protein TREMEDRAFT_59006 [Tremella mesenterica DSM 1558]EIW72838.1 hypothetical protein TREMEDRAFT_59006 [Tremella mesenterica DSM 1558]
MAHQPQPLKILAIGSPLSALGTLVDKVTSINSKHGPFDACVIVGDLFKQDSDGSELGSLASVFPVPTYFTIGKYALPQSVKDKIEETGGEVVRNLVFLGKSGVLSTAQGLKIAYVGGTYDEETYNIPSSENSSTSTISQNDVNALLSNPLISPATKVEDSLASARDGTSVLPSPFQGIDLLLTSPPPPSLSLLSPSFPSSGISLATPAPPLAEVIRRARPRYLFWADGEGFWEREPWGWSGSDGKEERWTRAVKLGALGGETSEGGKKPRWFYAFSLPAQTPTTALPKRPANATPNPLVLASAPAHNERKRPPLEDQHVIAREESTMKKGRTGPTGPPDSYICKVCKVPGVDCPQRKEVDHTKPPPNYSCKICGSHEHFIRECPEKDKSDAPRNTQGRRVPSQNYVCRACGAGGQHYLRDCPVHVEKEQEKHKKKELGPAECWFCLSNPKVTKHLIVAIGSETYVTLPKGQLIPTTAAQVAQGGFKPLVPGGGHVLIIPIAHHPTLMSIPAEDAMSIITELESYKSSLRACYAAYQAVPVTFEIGRLSGRGGHAHVQVVPVPKELTDKVAHAFRVAGEKQGIDWEDEPERALARVGPTGNYFKVECPDGTKMVHLLKGNFDLQFGRMILAGLLGLPHRIDWKDCGQTEAEEKEDAQKFKKAFAPFHS